jgi:hypothetical protein
MDIQAKLLLSGGGCAKNGPAQWPNVPFWSK